MIEDLRLKTGRPPEEIDPLSQFKVQRSRLQGKLAKSAGNAEPRKRLTTIPRHEYERRARFAEEKLSLLLRAAASFFFPSRCLACRSRPVERFLRGGVCEICWESLPRPAADRCDLCDEALTAPCPDISRCGRCLLSPPPFDHLRTAAPYSGSAREILMAFKFGADFRFAPREVLTDRLGGRRHRRRASHRRDHSRRPLGYAGLPFDARRLEKIRPTERQSGLRSRAGRRTCAGLPGASRRSRRVLLVDDVATRATARSAPAAARGRFPAGGVWCLRARPATRGSRDRVRRAPSGTAQQPARPTLPLCRGRSCAASRDTWPAKRWTTRCNRPPPEREVPGDPRCARRTSWHVRDGGDRDGIPAARRHRGARS
jgi:predicted amidophosphoribosyltransferase